MKDKTIELPEPYGYFDNASPGWSNSQVRDAQRAAIEADRKRQGEVVVTKTPEGEIIAVTRQDAEGKILSVIAETDRKRRGELVAAGLRNLLERCREFIDTTTCPAYPAGTDIADDIDAFLAPQPAEPSRGEPVGYIMPTALRQLKAGGNAIVGGVNQGGDVAVYLAPQPEEPLSLPVACGSCGYTADPECLTCSPQPAEPVKVPSDADLFAIHDEYFPTMMLGHDNYLSFARALLARYGTTTKEQP